jgi:hypothetical protein
MFDEIGFALTLKWLRSSVTDCCVRSMSDRPRCCGQVDCFPSLHEHQDAGEFSIVYAINSITSFVPRVVK